MENEEEFDMGEHYKEANASDNVDDEQGLPTHQMDDVSRGTSENVAETPEEMIERLKSENVSLKNANEVAQDEKEVLQAIVDSQPEISDHDSQYMKDLAFFDKQKVDAGKITIQDISDHKNVSLWTKWGKRVGPQHPHNAKYAYHKFRKMGVILRTEKPTEKEIQAYYKTPEYLNWRKAEDVRREKKSRSRKKGQVDRILNAMVTMTGMDKEALVSIADKPGG